MASAPEYDPRSLLTEATVAELRRHPKLWATAKGHADATVERFTRLEEPFRWMVKDQFRVGITYTAMLLRAAPQGLSAATLIAACKDMDISSPGRVRQFLSRGLQYGEIVTTPGSEYWTKRALVLGPGFFQHFSAVVRNDMEHAAAFAPETADGFPLADHEASMLHYILVSGFLQQAQPELFRNQPGHPMYIFGHREAGMFTLAHLLRSQPLDRARFLEEAPLSRSDLARRFGVSRVHINKLLSDAADDGLLSCPSPDRVVFSQRMSDAFERQYALLLLWIRVSTAIAWATLPAGSLAFAQSVSGE